MEILVYIAQWRLVVKNLLKKFLMGFDSYELNNLINENNSLSEENVLLKGKEILDFYDNYLMTRLSNVFMKKSDHASMKYSKELRSPYLQGEYKEFRSMLTFFDNFITKFKLKIFLINSLGLFDIFRKKVGFNILTENNSESAKNILLWSYDNKELIELIFNYDVFIKLVRNIRHDRYLYRIQVLIKWLETFHEKK